MKIEKLIIANDGYVNCHSCYYSSKDVLKTDSTFCLNSEINKMYGEIDSGVWAVSYLLSMYRYRPRDFMMFSQPEVMLNDSIMSLNELSKYTCYMDVIYPLFTSKKSVKKLVLLGLKQKIVNCSADDIRQLFCIDRERFERPIAACGNEIFKAMAAIGYCYGKEIFCFPWLSKRRFENYHNNIIGVLDVLSELNKMAILPLGE